MGILIDNNTRVVVQGATGKEGAKSTQNMINYQTQVSCGVTPGKGGTEINGLKIFDSVKEALEFDNLINTSVIYVPPLLVLDATMEAIKAGIKMVFIVTENVPIKDSAKIYNFAQEKGTIVIGPSSIGAINVGVCKIGSIGGSKNEAFTSGRVGIISKSGGMCSETALILSNIGIGQSTVVGIGGEVIAGFTFTDGLKLFQEDEETDLVVIFGEIGGRYEELAAEMIKRGEFTKPVVAYISGSFAETLPRNRSLGHVGAIIESGNDSASYKKDALRKSGVLVADFHDEIPNLVKQALEKLK
ncbi:MAG: CoA-binding protein [Candidatus Heimdallarchaeota archaeon]|nr:CoA-binding protein [Candidatus Heimdallarchaeota archaeon]MDH5647060.1 CoA-binding protein [Candidatus Heimdallarchaeota archaeon]